MCLPNTKRIFSRTRKMMFSLWLKWLRFNCFWECRFWRYQRWQFENNNFSKKICYGSFRYLSALRKNVFSGAPLKYVFLYGSNNSDFVVFWNLAFGEIKNHSQRTTLFQKKIVMEVLGLHLPYIKRYFQKHQLSAFYFMAQITQILLFLGMLLLERSKITVWEWCLFKTRFAMEVLGLCVPYIRRYFQEHHSSVFFFMAQISQILLFSGMLILQWSNITVWAQ